MGERRAATHGLAEKLHVYFLSIVIFFLLTCRHTHFYFTQFVFLFCLFFSYFFLMMQFTYRKAFAEHPKWSVSCPGPNAMVGFCVPGEASP